MKHTRQAPKYTFDINRKELSDLIEWDIRQKHPELPLGRRGYVILYNDIQDNLAAVVTFMEKEE